MHDEKEKIGMKKTAVITGASRGIGFAIARRMLQNGYVACILDVRTEEEAREQVRQLRALGEVFYFCGSTADPAQRAAFVREVMARFGRIDVLVNNAGVAPRVRLDLLETTEESFDFVVGVNVKGTLFTTQLIAREMVKQPPDERGMRGVIVNISSFSSTVSSPNRAEYCVSKAGVSMLTRLFADRLAPHGVYVYEVQPGIIQTDMTAAVRQKYDRLLQGSDFPIHRWGQPEDVANAVCLLTDGGLTYTTGQVIHVDGGYMNVRTI